MEQEGMPLVYLRDQADMNVCKILDAHFELKLPECLNERHAFYIANSAAQLVRKTENQTWPQKQALLTSMTQISGILLSSLATGVLATLSTHSWMVSVMWGTTAGERQAQCVNIEHITVEGKNYMACWI